MKPAVLLLPFVGQAGHSTHRGDTVVPSGGPYQHLSPKHLPPCLWQSEQGSSVGQTSQTAGCVGRLPRIAAPCPCWPAALRLRTGLLFRRRLNASASWNQPAVQGTLPPGHSLCCPSPRAALPTPAAGLALIGSSGCSRHLGVPPALFPGCPPAWSKGFRTLWHMVALKNSGHTLSCPWPECF